MSDDIELLAKSAGADGVKDSCPKCEAYKAELKPCLEGNAEYGKRISQLLKERDEARLAFGILTESYNNLRKKLSSERDRAVAIADGMMAWETLQQARQSSKDLSQLKKEINE